jgi:hypothetical protein
MQPSENTEASSDILEFKSALQASKLPLRMRKQHPSQAVAVLVTGSHAAEEGGRG